MKSFGLTLCNGYFGSHSTFNTVEYAKNGTLMFVGGDYWKEGEGWGEDYFYGYIFTKEQADVFFEAIRTEGETIEDTIMRRFGGHDGLTLLGIFLRENKIDHQFTTDKFLLGC